MSSPDAGGSPQPAPRPAAAPLTESEDRQWASFAHLGGILSFLPSLIIWLVFKERGRFTEAEAKEALNFQITLMIVHVVAWILSATIVGAIIGIPLDLAAWVVSIVFSILGFLKAKDGVPYRYPFAVRLIK
ncbi:DUF4870 domain-containing protein [Rathayibacter sp. VKM Ac-2803]|uniref:DUF4870 domain-containing protein n=1 Tax=unclassified Rathayibacter TaxID=2609250 RepID=UPI00135987B8|nr:MULTISPECIES: DUF4870 domain-containing protein [unclassified Rathayibacter]MWV50273.1 DUF4870 domain-containing protein [Rathayibacter sp. VKM Ac-2803]MWV60430.1 DUF4870 domain-containing protein [Rathayibacter sp. VKM Ac-2754]